MEQAPSQPRQNSAASAGKTSLLGKLGLSIVTLLFAFVVGELVLRTLAYRANAGFLANALVQVEVPSADPDAKLINIIRLTENERIVYELQASMRERPFRHTRVSTNELGFRVGPPVPEDARPLITILGIGDSIMFGHGVADDEPYLYLLQGLLQAKYPSHRWRVINTGTPGYNTVMEVETLITKGLAFEPDIVILNIVGNDYAPPYFVRDEIDVLAARSFAMDFVRERVSPRLETDDSFKAGYLSRGEDLYKLDGAGQEVVPERYRLLFGKRAFVGALDELKRLSEQHDFRVLAFTTYEVAPVFEMVAQAKARGMAHSTLMPELRAWMFEHLREEWTPAGYSKSPLVVGHGNSHPSREQHRMAAQRLLADLEVLGWLDAPLAK